jgi:hypothetical protein
VAPDPISRRRAVGNHQKTGHPAAWPASVGGDPWSEPRLTIDTDHGLVGIPNRRLDLDDRQHSGERVATDDVN